MARGKRDGLLIAGGGLAGCLAALALARHRPDVSLLIVEEDTKFGGDGLWWALADELGEKERALIEPLVEYRWPGYYLAFPGANRNIRSDILAFSAAQLQIAVAAALKPDQYRLGTRAVAVREDALVLDDGETIKADGAIDARGATNLSVLRFLYRTALVRDLSFKTPHRLDRPVLIDAAVDGGGAFRYAECLPIDETRMMIAGTTIGEAPHIDASAMREWIDNYIAARGWVTKRGGKGWKAIHPMPVEGDFGAFWRIGGARVAKIGMRGGFMHPATGRTLGDAARTALLLSRQQDFSGAALHELFEREAKRLWKERTPLRAFGAALADVGPDDRRDLFARIYSMKPTLLSRFHSGRLGFFDRPGLQRAIAG